MTTLELARRFVGVKETEGGKSTPLVLAMLQRVDPSVQDDSTAWCSAFVGFVAWLLGLPESHSLAARSWLQVGTPIALPDAQPGDVVILTRGPAPQPGPDVLHAPGHVGFFDRFDGTFVWLIGGNQGQSINMSGYPATRVLGIRRLT